MKVFSICSLKQESFFFFLNKRTKEYLANVLFWAVGFGMEKIMCLPSCPFCVDYFSWFSFIP